MASITSITDEALIAFDNLQDTASNLFSPTLRLGVTGLSRAGKTVFISSLIHNLLHEGRLPMFQAHAGGRIAKAELQPQPSMNVPRFQYEQHIDALVNKRIWPDSTRAISELRLAIHFESASGWSRNFGSGTLNLDIVDYPGEWLLDLPLLGMTFEQWSAQALALARLGNREKLSKHWLASLAKIDPLSEATESNAQKLAEEFTEYLRECRQDETALSTLPPGRFLMPGDLEGSPALTFSPLDLNSDSVATKGSLHKMMQERFEAYKSVVIRPFFREHFARLDRQIVLVDALQAINAGPDALLDLEHALSDILSCFKTGSNSLLGSLFSRKIDRILFAATKADHLHHENHDRMEKLLSALVKKAVERARYSGAKVDVVALAAVRATKEAIIKQDGEEYAVILGTPIKGEKIDGKTFNGEDETAIFPGDLPEDPAPLFDNNLENDPEVDLRFVRFRPPVAERKGNSLEVSLPHIRLDRAMQFLMGDKLA
ncbi:MAG: YcjX family protein [Salaquimonas sp.]